MPIVNLTHRVIAQLEADPKRIGAQLHAAGVDLVYQLFNAIPPGKPKGSFRNTNELENAIWQHLDADGVPDTDWVAFTPLHRQGPPCALLIYQNGVDVSFIMTHWSLFEGLAKTVAEIDLKSVRSVHCLKLRWILGDS